VVSIAGDGGFMLGVGARGYGAESPKQLTSLLRDVFDNPGNGPVLIEVPCERGSEASPFEFLLPANYGR